MRHEESRIQQSAVKWFRLQYPKLAPLLFSVPNGGYRNKIEAAIMKAEGTVAGVADLILLYPSCLYHGLLIEMKTPKGRQRPTQKDWQNKVEQAGYKYIICRSLEDFMSQIRDYLNN